MPPINYNQELGQARCHDAVLRKRQNAIIENGPNGINCWKAQGSTNNDGYVQIYLKKNSDIHRTGRSAQTAFLLHVVSYVASRGHNPPGGHHVSHLCDQRNCFNPEHLVAELPQVNNSRKGCPGPIFCPEHGHELINLCRHQPQCIRPPNTDATCCLTIRNHDAAWRGMPSRTASAVSQQSGARDSDRLTQFSRADSSAYSGADQLEAANEAGELDDIYSADAMP